MLWSSFLVLASGIDDACSNEDSSVFTLNVNGYGLLHVYIEKVKLTLQQCDVLLHLRGQHLGDVLL